MIQKGREKATVLNAFLTTSFLLQYVIGLQGKRNKGRYKKNCCTN